MPKLNSVESLEELRERLRRELSVQTATSTTITVGMGTCGISAGARQVMDAIRHELEARDIEAHVTAVGCIGMCSKEPLVDIQQGDEPRITYGNVRPRMVSRIVEQHLVKGQVVDDWAVGRTTTGWQDQDG